MSYYLLIILCFVLGVILPFSLLTGREKIREKRYEIIADLESILFKTPKDSTSIPSFELVKYKYRPQSESGKRNESIQDRLFRIPVSLYSLTSTIGLLVAVTYLNEIDTTLYPSKLLTNRYCLIFTFLGGYIWTIQFLIRKLANFDLSPISFYRSTIHILLGLAVCAALSLSGVMLLISEIPYLTAARPALAAALLIGFVPSVFLEYITELFPKLRMKRVSKSSKKLQDELPLDIIYGIDPFIKFRLAEFEIEDIQNLATTNPIQLFVETPYRLYEIIDWIAQAQLILGVGPEKTFQLRRFNVRTIFDLAKMNQNPWLKSELLKILTSDTDESRNTIPINIISTDTFSSGTNKHAADVLVNIIQDDLHVRRLQQIWKIIDQAIEATTTTASQRKGNVHKLP